MFRLALRTPFLATALALATAAPLPAAAQQAASAAEIAAVHYRTIKIDGVDIFYREAGPSNAPVVLLLHGFPTSSRMYRNLIPALADRYHVVAPDYPGFGRSGVPDRKAFVYSFAHFSTLIDSLMTALKLDRYALFVQDYGAPVGYRLALAHPERVSGLIIQNGNAYTEGLSPFWKPIQAYWADPSLAHRNALRAGLTAAATRSQYVDGASDPSRVDPETWEIDQQSLDRPGVNEIMLDLFLDYRTNVALYPQFQTFFRTRRPSTLIVWGRNDVIFPAEGAKAYLRDLPQAEIHILDTDHFALEDKGGEIARLIRDFLDRTQSAGGSGK